jgi:hypothetical protein
VTLRYLLDEHVDPTYRTQLLRHAPELIVWRIGAPGAPPRGTPDPAILEWCETNGFVLITNNRASIPGHLAEHLARGRHVPGIIMLNPNLSMGEMIAELALIGLIAEEQTYQDLLVYLPLT